MSDEAISSEAAARPSARPRKAAPKKAPRWSVKAQRAFLAHLAETANVAASARKGKLSESTFRRRARADPDFAASWAAALREGYLKLEGEMLARALGGSTKDVWHGGKKVGQVREYNDRIGLALLNLHREAVTGRDTPPAAPIPIEEARARFRERLAEMNRRMGGEG